MTPARPGLSNEKQLIAAARAGDEAAFQRLVGAYEGELEAHCYRMLGSTHDAEDALQDAMLRAWKGIGRFQGRSSLRSWLYRIATNTSLDLVERRPKRVLPIDYAPAGDPHDGPGVPLTESVWIDPYPDGGLGVGEGSAGTEARYEQRESVELAFIAALQHLPARQRAALILREVLGFSAKEVAEALETTVASVNSALQRARKTVEEKLPGPSQQQTMRDLGDAELRELVGTYMDAWERGDVDAVREMLAEDAAITMPPMASWFAGREAVTTFLREFALARPWDHERGEFAEGRRRVRLLETSANGQPAFGAYRWHEDEGAYLPFNLMVLSFEPGGAIAEITGFVDPAVPPSFGLPERLEA
jgi:RNA polymerase sigma-70 factor (ECF subfamily)